MIPRSTSRWMMPVATFGLMPRDSASLFMDVSPRAKMTANALICWIVRYLQQQVPVSIAFTAARPEFVWSNPPTNNLIDRLVFDKLRRLRMAPLMIEARDRSPHDRALTRAGIAANTTSAAP